MWPYAIGAAVIALFAIKGAGASASQGQMIFKDYQWLVLMPSTVANSLSTVIGIDKFPLFPGTLNPATVAALPPPPGQAAGSGKWVEYPGGYQSARGVAIDPRTGAPAAIVPGQHYANPPPGEVGNPIFPVFPDVPKGMSVYAWRPTTDVLTQINGYSVMTHHWVFESTDSRSLSTTGGILVYQPKWHLDQGQPPPPPGQSASSGVWHGVAPGYVVWLTPANTNQGAVAQSATDPAQAAWLSQGATGGGTPNTAPTLTPQSNPAVPPAY